MWLKLAESTPSAVVAKFQEMMKNKFGFLDLESHNLSDSSVEIRINKVNYLDQTPVVMPTSLYDQNVYRPFKFYYFHSVYLHCEH